MAWVIKVIRAMETILIHWTVEQKQLKCFMLASHLLKAGHVHPKDIGRLCSCFWNSCTISIGWFSDFLSVQISMQQTMSFGWTLGPYNFYQFHTKAILSLPTISKINLVTNSSNYALIIMQKLPSIIILIYICYFGIISHFLHVK